MSIVTSGQEQEQLLVGLVEQSQSKYFGKYRGIVRDNNDSDNLGRIRVEVPHLYGTGQISPWAWPVVPFAGKAHGLMLLPEVNDGVWIEFEGGDLSHPLWTGGWWAEGEMPTVGKTNATVLVTSGGHQIILDDGDREIKLVHSGGAEIKMTDTEIILKVGSKQIKISAAGVDINNGAFKIN
jgi:uncharacterized protein involved in type VI secretion and phage assembly